MRRQLRSDFFFLKQEGLEELRRTLSLLSEPHVRQFYERAYEECKLAPKGVPPPRAVQELVAAWKILWKWR